MNTTATTLFSGTLIGAGGTVVLDLWVTGLKRLFDVPSRNWGLVGRWVAQFPHGRLFFPRGVAQVTPVRGEQAIGWTFHYAVGAAYGVLVLLLAGIDWLRHPTLLVPLAVGVLSLSAPFFFMDPALGNGFFAMRAPRPWMARARALLNHIVFAVGMFATACLLADG